MYEYDPWELRSLVNKKTNPFENTSKKFKGIFDTCRVDVNIKVAFVVKSYDDNITKLT